MAPQRATVDAVGDGADAPPSVMLMTKYEYKTPGFTARSSTVVPRVVARGV